MGNVSGNFQNSGWLIPFPWLRNVSLSPGPEPGADSRHYLYHSQSDRVTKLFVLVSEPIPDIVDELEGLVRPRRCPSSHYPRGLWE
jgi:hypothetical protein